MENGAMSAISWEQAEPVTGININFVVIVNLGELEM